MHLPNNINRKYNARNAGKIIGKSSDAAHTLLKKLHNSHPVDNARVLLNTNLVPVKNNLAQAGKELQHYMYFASRQLHRAVWMAIAGGIGYGVYTCRRNNWHPIEEVKTHIQQKPVKSALIALGIGFLMGRIYY